MDFLKIKRFGLDYLLPLVLFFVLAAGYFAPQFEGKVLPQHDVQQYAGMTKDILDCREQFGEDPQWTGNMFGGMPSYLINTAYPAEAVKGSFGQIVKLFGQPMSFIFFAMTAFWIMLLMMGVRRQAAIVGAVAYGLSTYFLLIIGAGHITKMWALVYAPLMVGAVDYAFRRNMWVGGAMTALFTSLEIGAGHPQITYYFILVLAAMWVNYLVAAIREKCMPRFWRTTLVVAAAGILAVGSNFSPLWYTAQHSPDTIRGGSVLAEKGDDGSKGLDLQYATAWSYGRTESLNMLIPDLMGGSSTTTFARDGELAKALDRYGLRQVASQLPMYWGDQPYTAGPTYLGATVLFLAVLGCLVLCGRKKWWIIVIAILAVFLAWGRNMMWFTELCFRILPGYDKFRTVSMILVVVQWCVPLLAALAVSRLADESYDRRRAIRNLGISAGIVGGICLIIALFGGSIFDFGRSETEQMMTEQWRQMLSYSGAQQYVDAGLHEELGIVSAEAMAAERADVMTADAWRSLIFVLLTAAALWLYLRGKMRFSVTAAALVALVAVDLIPVDLRFLPQDTFVSKRSVKISPTEADRMIMADTTLGYRVLNLTVSPFNDATTSYFHRSVGGYHGAKLSRYQDLIDNYLSMVNYGIDSSARKVLDMLNTKYLIRPTGVEVNDAACGAAWFVDRIYLVENPREEMDALGQIDPHTEATVERQFEEQLDGFDTNDGFDGRIELTEYRPNYLKYRYSASGQGVAVFSEIYYDKGWKAYIDGVEAPYFRADYLLRGMSLPAGEHTVEWRFRAPDFGLVEGVTLTCSLIIIGGLVAVVAVAVVRRRKSRNKNSSNINYNEGK